MHYDSIDMPADGEPIGVNADFTVDMPDRPIIPLIEGDGIGVYVTPVMQQVVDVAVARAYGDHRRIAWCPGPGGSELQASGRR